MKEIRNTTTYFLMTEFADKSDLWIVRSLKDGGISKPHWFIGTYSNDIVTPYQKINDELSKQLEDNFHKNHA